MIPAIRNDSQTAAPATAPAAPRRAKIPAPTIEPTPMYVACSTVMRLAPVVELIRDLRSPPPGRSTAGAAARGVEPPRRPEPVIRRAR